MEEYESAPVTALLGLGEPDYVREIQWPDYRALGLGPEHIQALISIATNHTWINLPDETDPLGWAPIHAWRALGQLQAAEAIEPLMRLFHEIHDNDWVMEELPDVFAELGPAAFEPLAEYLFTDSYPSFARMIAATSMTHLALSYPQVRSQAITALSELLRAYRSNTPGINSILIARLVALDAQECGGLIHEVFAESKVDRFITGDWRDIKKRFARVGKS